MAKGRALKAARRQAQAEAAVKYDPQQRVLLGALGTARQEEVRAVHAAKGTSSALSAAIKHARKPLTQGYADASRTASAARGDLYGHLTSLGAPAAPFAAAVAREQAGVTSRSAQERANALGELTLRGVQAKEGRASSIQNAHQQYATDAGSIYRQLIGTAQDRGTFTAAQIGDIRQAQRTVAAQNARANLQARTSTANSKRTARTSRRNTDVRAHQSDVNSQRTAANKAAKANKPKAELQGSHKLKAQVINARAEYERQLHLHPNRPLRRIAADARKGGVSDLVLNAAADLANLGGITPGHLAALRQAGVTHVPKAWRHPQPPRGRTAARTFTF